MPLPPNGILSLQGPVGPGGADTLKPKQAMIVRMSQETFEALEAQPNPPKVEVEFGANSGLYIGDNFFPMRPQQESLRNELYMRSVPPNKTTGPLRFYANVVGKFMVERELGSKMQNNLRVKKEAAEKQRTERKIKILDALPPSAPPVKASKKKVTTTKKQSTAINIRTISASSSAQASRMVSPRPPSTQPSQQHPSRPSPRPPASSVASDSDRARLIHFLALNPRTLTEVMRSVGGIQGDQPFRQDLTDLLKEVAAPGVKQTASGTSPQKWLLKIKTWEEVKPFTYPNLSNQERLKLAEKAASAYKKLGIPPSDPKWDDIRSPSSGASRIGPASTSTTDARRSATSQEAKVKQTNAESSMKPKTASSEVSSKNERLKIPKYEDLDDAIPSAATSKAPARRLPGSGFKMKAGSNTPPTPELPPSRSESRRPDVRSIKIEKTSHQSASLPPPPPQDARPSMNSNASTTRIPQNGRETREFARPADPVRERPRESPAPGSSLKRKKEPRDEQELDFSERESVNGSAKKRRIEENASERREKRDLSLPKKPVAREPSPLPRHKISRYDGRSPLLPPSPLPLAASPRIPHKQPPHDRAPSLSSNRSRDDTSQRSSSVRPRRKSPIYTSSEDEDDRPRRRNNDGAAPRRDREDQRQDKPPSSTPAPPNAPPSTTTTITPSFKKLSSASAHTVLSLPDSPEVLRKIYNRHFLKYSSLRREHQMHVEDLQDLLREGGDEVYLPDGDPRLPNLDEFRQLRENLDKEERMLHAIVDKWEEMMRQGKLAEGVTLTRPNED